MAEDYKPKGYVLVVKRLPEISKGKDLPLIFGDTEVMKELVGLQTHGITLFFTDIFRHYPAAVLLPSNPVVGLIEQYTRPASKSLPWLGVSVGQTIDMASLKT